MTATPREWPPGMTQERADKFVESVLPEDVHLDRPSANGRADAPPRKPRRFEVIDDDELEKLPKPDWLVDGLVPQRALVMLYGASEVGKTFLTVDLGFCIATGISFHGRSVARGRVIYVAAEGGAGLGVRVAAWKESNEQYGRAGVGFISQPVRLVDEHQRDTRELINEIRAYATPELPVRLVVIDTLAWCMVGGNENATEDMGVVVDAMGLIRRETAATVLAIHHPGKNGSGARGSGSLGNGIETVIEVKRGGNLLTVRCEKQRDASKFPDFILERVEVADSCALLTAGSASAVMDPLRVPEAIQALRSLHDAAQPEEGLPTSKWLSVSGLKDRTFYESRKRLIIGGYVEGPTRKRGAPNLITPKGQNAITANCNTTA